MKRLRDHVEVLRAVESRQRAVLAHRKTSFAKSALGVLPDDMMWHEIVPRLSDLTTTARLARTCRYLNGVIWQYVKVLKVPRRMPGKASWRFTGLVRLDLTLASAFPCEALVSLTRLVGLTLGNSVKSPIFGSDLEKLVSLESLHLGWSYYRPALDGSFLRSLKNLTTLHLGTGFDWMTDESLSQLTHLVRLTLGSYGSITDTGVRPLVHLTQFDFRWNSHITDAGIATLLHLETLCVNDNITNKGLSQCPRLEKLHIGNNTKITAEGLLPLTKLRRLVFVLEGCEWDAHLPVHWPETMQQVGLRNYLRDACLSEDEG